MELAFFGSENLNTVLFPRKFNDLMKSDDVSFRKNARNGTLMSLMRCTYWWHFIPKSTALNQLIWWLPSTSFHFCNASTWPFMSVCLKSSAKIISSNPESISDPKFENHFHQKIFEAMLCFGFTFFSYVWGQRPDTIEFRIGESDRKMLNQFPLHVDFLKVVVWHWKVDSAWKLAKNKWVLLLQHLWFWSPQCFFFQKIKKYLKTKMDARYPMIEKGHFLFERYHSVLGSPHFF